MLEFLEVLAPSRVFELDVDMPKSGLRRDILATLMLLNTNGLDGESKSERMAEHQAHSILSGMWREPPTSMMVGKEAEALVRRVEKGEKPLTRAAELTTAAAKALDRIADLLLPPINSILAEALGGTRGAARAIRREMADLEHEEGEAATREETEATERLRIDELTEAEWQRELATRQESARQLTTARHAKWTAARTKQQSEVAERAGKRPVEGTSRLGPVMLQRLGLNSQLPPPWSPSGVAAAALVQINGGRVRDSADEDLDWKTEFKMQSVMAAAKRGIRGSKGRARGRRRSSSGAGSSQGPDARAGEKRSRDEGPGGAED